MGRKEPWFAVLRPQLNNLVTCNNQSLDFAEDVQVLDRGWGARLHC